MLNRKSPPGTVQSSQVDLQGPQAKDGYVTLTISCEMEQGNLQKLLYDLEVGMPFLFIDQLVVQGPELSTIAADARMRILIAVSGEWKGASRHALVYNWIGVGILLVAIAVISAGNASQL